MKLRFDLVEKITPEMLMESVLANHHRYKAEPLLSKTGTGSLSPASTEDRCDRGKALHGHNSETYERVRNRWEEHSPRELTLGDTLDFLLDCHRSAPFLFFKGKKDCIMIPFHSLLPEIAQREVRCIHLGAAPGESPDSGLSAGEYAFVEFYCEDLDCDCRRVFIEVIARHQQDQVLASINYGWDEESFYRKRMSWDPDAPRQIVRGSLDPINQQSEHAEELLELFQRHVLDEAYRLRLRRHHQLFRNELRRRRHLEPPK